MIRLTLVYAIGIFMTIALAIASAGAAAPYTVKSWRVNEDAEYVYYSDTRSDGTETTRKVKKPKLREYPSSITLVATNDLPVQIQYVYKEIYPTGRVATNYQYRTKTARERSKITLPPMPEIATRPPRNKADALRLAKQHRQRINTDAKPHGYKPMRRTDPVISQEITGNRVRSTHRSGRVTLAPLKRAYTARVKSAPLKKTNRRKVKQ